jgi:hypothetical protein
MGHYTQAFGLHMVLAPVDGVGGCGCGLWREHPRVGQSAEMSLDVRGRPSGRPSEGASVRAWSTTSRLPRIAGTVGWSGPSAASPIASARSYCSPAPSRHDRRSGWTLLNRRPDTHSDTRLDRRPRWTPCLACWTARADTKTDGRRGRPHGRTRVLWSSAVVHPCGLAGEHE